MPRLMISTFCKFVTRQTFKSLLSLRIILEKCSIIELEIESTERCATSKVASGVPTWLQLRYMSIHYELGATDMYALICTV